MTEPGFDVAVAHRWFAIECNNAAWDLVESSSRAVDDTQRMLDLAHAAAWHWSQVGKPINQLRAVNLLATAYIAAGLSASALQQAERGRQLAGELRDALTPFDRACVHGALAAALQLAGRSAESHLEYEIAYATAGEFDNPDDRAVFERLYPHPA
jgi:hypothetical protein